MRSMTGYGSGRCTAEDGTQCSVEIQSVNRRQSELMINLPRDLGSLEPRVREAINARVARGRLVINVHYQTRAAADGPQAQAFDVAAARKYYDAMRMLQRILGAAGEVSIETVLRAPGVMRATEETADPTQLWPQIESALRHALDELVAMRAQEGKHLADDLRVRLKEIRARLADIRTRQPDAAIHYRQTLHERLQRAGLHPPIDDDRAWRKKSSCSPTAATFPRRSHAWKVISTNSSPCWKKTNPSAARWISFRRKWRAN